MSARPGDLIRFARANHLDACLSGGDESFTSLALDALSGRVAVTELSWRVEREDVIVRPRGAGE